MNENNIKWIKSKSNCLRYKNNEEDYSHRYYPDFYLPETDEYVEIKGYMWKNDKEKMIKVKIYNPNIKLKILIKEDLILLGIKI